MPDPNPVVTMNPATAVKQPTPMAAPSAADTGVAAPDPTTISSPSASPAATTQPQAPQYGGWQTHGFGRVLNTVLGGSKMVYRPDPNSPNGAMVPDTEPMKPGEMFRHILGAGLLGLASGAGTKDFGQGFQRGYGSQVQKQEQDEEKARQQAQQDFQNRRQMRSDQLAQNADHRAQSELELRQQEGSRQAEIHKMNMGLANNQLALSVFQLQGKSLELHKEQAALDEPAVNAMREGGVKPLGPEVGETEMKDLLAKDPSATTKRWLATGVKQWIDPSGKVQYELKFTPYDPQAKVTLKGEDLKRFIKRADDSGFSKYMPEFSVIRKVDPKTGYTFSPEQWNALVYGKNGIMAMEDKDLDKREKLARISNYSLQAQKARVELADIQEGKSAEKALVSLQSANWDISKLKPAERAAIQKVAPTMQAKYFDQYNKLLETANKTDDPTQKQALQSQASGLVPTYDFWKGLTSPTAPKVEAGSEKPISPEAKQVVSELKEYPHATYDDIMKDPRLKNVPQQLDALKGANIAVPARGVKHIAEMSKNLGELPDGTKMSRYMTEDEAYEKTVAYLQKQGIAAEGAPMQVVRRGPGF